MVTITYKKKCPICKKVIESLHKGQLEWNYETHLRSCEAKQEEKKK